MPFFEFFSMLFLFVALRPGPQPFPFIRIVFAVPRLPPIGLEILFEILSFSPEFGTFSPLSPPFLFFFFLSEHSPSIFFFFRFIAYPSKSLRVFFPLVPSWRPCLFRILKFRFELDFFRRPPPFSIRARPHSFKISSSVPCTVAVFPFLPSLATRSISPFSLRRFQIPFCEATAGASLPSESAPPFSSLRTSPGDRFFVTLPIDNS